MSLPYKAATMSARERMINKQIGFLEKMIRLERKIQAKKERERLKRHSRNEKYTTIFEPITKKLTSLVDHQKHKEEPSPSPPPAEPDLMNFTEEPKVEKEEWLPEDLKTLEPPESLYSQALDSIPKKDRDDGLLSLNWRLRKIGDSYFSVIGNTLFIEKSDGSKKAFNINNINVWLLLLKQRPSRRSFDEQSIKEYTDIVNNLDLVSNARHSGIQYWNRVKYKLLENSGSGLHFAPSILVIPSDRQGLLRNLAVTLAEYQAGNVGLLGRAKALIEEAKRKKFVPPGQLTCVYT